MIRVRAQHLAGVLLIALSAATRVGAQERVPADQSAPSEVRVVKAQRGDSLTRIKIQKIGVDVVVVEGTTPSALRAGAGHYPETPLPCEDANVGISATTGHRPELSRTASGS